MQKNREIFRAIDGYDNYEISNHGRVRNVITERILKSFKTGGKRKQYLAVDLKHKTVKIHKLVADAFIENPNEYKIIDHIDGNSLNNNVDNLRWTTNTINTINSKMSKYNTSGITGVCFIKTRNSWVATWQNEEGKHCSKTFSLKQYGNNKAKELAIAYRKKMEKTLPRYREALKHQTNDEE